MNLFVERFHLYRSSLMTDLTRSREIPSCSAIDLAKPRLTVFQDYVLKLIKNVRVGPVIDRPRQGATQVEIKPRLNWATQNFMVACGGAGSSNVSQKWCKFPSPPYIAGKNDESSGLGGVKLRASKDKLIFSLYTKKCPDIRHSCSPLLILPSKPSIASYDIGSTSN
jgi:hypothetical protein